jgi:hypothetical protein
LSFNKSKKRLDVDSNSAVKTQAREYKKKPDNNDPIEGINTASKAKKGKKKDQYKYRMELAGFEKACHGGLSLFFTKFKLLQVRTAP